MTVIDTIGCEGSSSRPFLKALGKQLMQRMALYYRTHRTRRELAALSDEALADIGLTREAALGEAMRCFWDSNRL